MTKTPLVTPDARAHATAQARAARVRPKLITAKADIVRGLCDALIDDFLADGHCELVRPTRRASAGEALIASAIDAGGGAPQRLRHRLAHQPCATTNATARPEGTQSRARVSDDSDAAEVAAEEVRGRGVEADRAVDRLARRRNPAGCSPRSRAEGVRSGRNWPYGGHFAAPSDTTRGVLVERVGRQAGWSPVAGSRAKTLIRPGRSASFAVATVACG
jgi:hypothetical protein